MHGTTERTYGTLTAEERQPMTGLAFIQGIVAGTIPLNTMAKTLGYDITEATHGRAVVTATPTAAHLNPAGTVHGGYAATLLDSCMGLSVQTTLEVGYASTTVELKVSLVRAITPQTGVVRAEGLVINRGRRIAVAEGRLFDSADRLLAHATTTCLIFET